MVNENTARIFEDINEMRQDDLKRTEETLEYFDTLEKEIRSSEHSVNVKDKILIELDNARNSLKSHRRMLLKHLDRKSTEQMIMENI